MPIQRRRYLIRRSRTGVQHQIDRYEAEAIELLERTCLRDSGDEVGHFGGGDINEMTATVLCMKVIKDPMVKQSLVPMVLR